MSLQSRALAEYVDAARFETQWRGLVSSLGGRERVAGRSVEGRPLWRFDLGTRDPRAPSLLLTALIHGVELIGSVTLLDVVRRLGSRGPEGARTLLDEARVTVMPILNPDALARNMDRLGRGHLAWQRKNARGVDLNRNFAPVGLRPLRHPFAGSAYRLSPHHRGPYPFSEPESCAVRDVANELHPTFAVGFHSFGNLLLYPWAHSRERNPRFERYFRLGRAFVSKLPREPYRFKQASAFYPTTGDLDDWLDHAHQTLAFTVEVSALDARLLDPRRFVNPFWWMNPARIEPTIANVSPGVLGLLASALAPAPLS